MSDTQQNPAEAPKSNLPELPPLRDPLNTVRFVAYGPNRGKTGLIGGADGQGHFQFTNGLYECPRAYEMQVAAILTRFYDVCAERDMAAKFAEYDRLVAETAAADRAAQRRK